MKKRSLMFLLILIFGLFLAACSNADNTTDEGEESTEENNETSEEGSEESENNEEAQTENWSEDVVVLTGGEAGVYFPLGVAMADIMDEHVDGVSATGISSGASVVNANELHDDAAEFALLQNDIAYYAHEGSEMFSEVVDGFSGVFTIYPETIQIVTSADSGIETVEDLEGKRVAVGDIGSGTEANAKQILNAHDITYDDISAERMGFGDASTNLQDGNIDAAFVTAGTPTGSIQELAATTDIGIVSINDDKIDQLTEEYPYYTKVELDENTYENFDATATTIAPQAMLAVRDDLPEDQVYELVKSIFDNLDAMENAHERGADLTIDTAQDGMSIELHPGAKKFYDEQ
ncbi:TRAP transporter solute receptor TAXI family protein [Gracilibacillus halophilus YIM-C55.5]|uniref:TRAP transporter solute receptor TAXI family protein n=1 Tax=Gracilibacillus halophilus YIM-C55.5 TaxID=1308866 RepID=N4WXK7_9BACI|nr:TAXI family TRAP transporter solute-binding subunit [Gracilibacillus halophilus]ENH97826.1 TRAP transporter solute receptor TAXI family protein [Gracilibacillus halophilus YIM-C55.5]